MQAGIKRRVLRGTVRTIEVRGGEVESDLGDTQIEAMVAVEAEVVGEEVAVELLAQLGADGTASDATCETAQYYAGYGPKYGAKWPNDRPSRSAELPACQSSADAARSAAHGSSRSANFHGCVKRRDASGIAARTLQ